MPDMLVAGAGTSAVNGVYTDTDIFNGRPRYYAPATYRMEWDPLNAWVIWNGSVYAYYSFEDVATPDLVTSWTTSIGGSNPPPTVTLNVSANLSHLNGQAQSGLSHVNGQALSGLSHINGIAK